MYSKRSTFPCDICSKTYTAFNTLKNHKSAVHNVQLQNWKSEKQNVRGVVITPRQSSVKGPVRKLVSCNICAKQFESVELLAKHLVSGVHGKDKCNICHKKFSSVHFLAKHLVSGDHGKGKEVGVSKTNPKVVDVIDVDLDDEPIKFNIPQPVQKVAPAKKRRSEGNNVDAENVKKTKVDTDLVVEEEPKHWLDKMMKEVDDFSNNLINLVGDVKKNWSGGVKSEQCVTETTEKLREVLQISKNYIELIDKSVIDEYWANNQSGLWGQVPPLDEEAAALDEEAATLDENVTTTDEDGNSLDESVSMDENGETETVCTPDLPDMDLDSQSDLDENNSNETLDEENSSNETVEDEQNSSDETVEEASIETVEPEVTNICSEDDGELKNNTEDGTIADSDEMGDTKTDSEGSRASFEEVLDNGDKEKDSVIDDQLTVSKIENKEEKIKDNSEENIKTDEHSKEEEGTNESRIDKDAEEKEEINESDENEESDEVDGTEEDEIKENVIEQNALEEETVNENSEDLASETEDSAEAPPSSGMVLFASWCQ